ncbi:MAG: hypothetical protein V1901_04005 [Patescibacteria group bacterium]
MSKFSIKCSGCNRIVEYQDVWDEGGIGFQCPWEDCKKKIYLSELLYNINKESKILK